MWQLWGAARFLVVTQLVVTGLAHDDGIEDRTRYAEQVKKMFYHGWEAYLEYGFPSDELAPLSCSGIDTWGSYVRRLSSPVLVGRRSLSPPLALAVLPLTLFLFFRAPSLSHPCDGSHSFSPLSSTNEPTGSTASHRFAPNLHSPAMVCRL
jgi:hypothetical protein